MPLLGEHVHVKSTITIVHCQCLASVYVCLTCNALEFVPTFKICFCIPFSL